MTARADHPDKQPEILAGRIREALQLLHLQQVASRFEEALAAPQPECSRLEWLWSLLEPQARFRVESRTERRIRESRLPERKTLDGFDFAFQPELDKDLVLELATLGFLDRGHNVLLAGMSGTGKSHIAKALGLNACVANRRVRYTTSADMLATLTATLVDKSLPAALKAYTRPELLIIDEIGLEQVEAPVASQSGLLQKVLIPRYNQQRSTIVTSNIPWESWGEYFGDALGATAIIDRLLHHSHVIVIEGPSYRDHIHRQEAEERRTQSESAPPTEPSKADRRKKKRA